MRSEPMATHKLLLLPGDGIGPEVMAEVKRLIDLFNKRGPDSFDDRGRPGRRRLPMTPHKVVDHRRHHGQGAWPPTP